MGDTKRQFGSCHVFRPRQLATLLLGLLLALPAANTRASNWGAFFEGMTKELKKQGDDADEMRRQQQLLEYQHRLNMERIQRAAELENELRERTEQRERAERARAQDVIRQQQQIAEEKKQQEAAEQKRKAISTGTGFFVAPGGYLVTNHHVVDDTTDYAIRDHKGRFYKAIVVARDSNRDLALLKVDGTFPTLKIVSSDTVSKGQRVLAVGYPQVSIQGNESKVTDGIISSFSGIRNDDNWFQISVPIQGGNSGGPLVTENGGVVGVVVATANVARFYKLTGNLPQNVNYAIKSKVLLEFLNAQNLQNVTAAKGKVSVEAVDASTVLVIAKIGSIDVAYTASPEQTARVERERAKTEADARRTEEQRSAEAALIAKRDAAVLKAFPDWPEIKVSNIFVAWLAEQKKETSDKLDSRKATDVIAVIRQYHAELPKFANRYAAAQRPAVPAPTAIGAATPTLSPRPSPAPTTVQVIKDCDVCPEMVVIPAGNFEMGSNDGPANERPVHRVSVSSFLLGKTEVTQRQWKEMMGVNPSYSRQCGDDCPVERLTWGDAEIYTRKLSEHTGKIYRLPSEAEWEYAARAGGRGKWSFGDDASQLDQYGWWDINSSSRNHPVAQKLPNTFGLYDMHGNVSEWVQDVYHDNYVSAPVDGSAWRSNDEHGWRVLRGGSRLSNPEGLRSSIRNRVVSVDRSVDFGFRVARER